MNWAMFDDLSGYEFEELMEDAFRHLGYENVRRSRLAADEGGDIVMEEFVDGRRRTVVVACEHTELVTRPTVQAVQSALEATDADGPTRGMVVTTGQFTGPARGYAASLASGRDGGIELLDGRELREIAETIGVDPHSGRIEIQCTELLRPIRPTAGRDAPVFEAASEIDNLDPASMPTPETVVSLEPMCIVDANTDATFRSAAGVIHEIDEADELVVRSDRGSPAVAAGDVEELVANPSAPRVDLEDAALEERFDDVEREPFGRTETTYKQWAIDRLQRRHEATVEYADENGVDRETTCTPRRSEISIRSIDPVYVPHLESTVSLGEYEYRYAYYAAGPSRSTTTNELHRCVHCEGESDGSNEEYVFCSNCGSINCTDHVETEYLEGEPVCTGCAVTGCFAFRTRYFYDEENLEAFRERYAAMPIHEKAKENVPLAVGVVLSTLLTVLSIVGIGFVGFV